MTFMIFLVDAIFEIRVAQVTYMKNMSRKSKIHFWGRSFDEFHGCFIDYLYWLICEISAFFLVLFSQLEMFP